MSITINRKNIDFSSASTSDSSNIKLLVTEVMNDQLFLRNILQQLSLENLIRKEINDKTPDIEKRIKSKVKNYVLETISTKLNNFQRDQLPSYVAKELVNQITTFLNNHTQITQLLDYHTTQLNVTLTETARNTLSKLVDEPQYQMVTTAHLNTITTKCDIKLLEIQAALNQQLSNNFQCFEEQLKTLKNKNDRELSELKTKLDETTQLAKDFADYKVATSFNNKQIKELNDKIITLQWLLGISWVIIGGAYYLTKKIN